VATPTPATDTVRVAPPAAGGGLAQPGGDELAEPACDASAEDHTQTTKPLRPSATAITEVVARSAADDTAGDATQATKPLRLNLTQVTDGAAEHAAAGQAEPAKPLGLSLTQIAGGALAAVTAAVAASYLGVAGTLVGAALGSVVSSVGAALYSTSLRRAARVSKVLVVRPAGSETGPLEASAQDPAAVPPAVPREPLAGPIPAHWWTKVRWGPVAAVAGLLFVGAMAVVNLSELAIGHPLGNSTSSGTTLTNLGGSNEVPPSPSGGTPGWTPTATPQPTSSGPQVSPTPSASVNPTDSASPTSSPAPSSRGTTTSSPTTGTATTTASTAPAPIPPAPTPGG
jgi:hypothetical protein